MKPLFIVLEGIDGSGKTTQADYLQSYFENQGQAALLSPEPSSGPIGQLIRQVLATHTLPFPTAEQFDQQMGYLFAADRYYHLYNAQDGILQARDQQGCHIITPRYYFSSLAYNAHRPEDWRLIERLNQDFPTPDALIYLDLSVEQALQRIGIRQQWEYYEKEDKLRQVRQNYQRLFKNYCHPLLRLEADQLPEALHQQIVAFLGQL